MIHGKTKIELYNPNTKIKQVFRDENTFQANVLRDQFRSLPCIRQNKMGVDSFVTDIQKAFAGGLLLFRDTIEIGSYYMPAGNKMIGCGLKGTENLGTPVELGSYNSVESSEGNTSLTRVWDFATHQANGSIGCICLTPSVTGYGGYGNPSGVRRTSGYSLAQYCETSNTSEYKLSDNGYLYAFATVTVESTRYLRIYKQRTISNKGEFFAGKVTYTDIEITSSLDLTGFDFADSTCYSHHIGTNKFRILPQGYYYAPYDVASGETFYYWEVDVSTGTLSRKSFVNSSSDTICGYTYSPIQGNYTAGTPVFTVDDKIIIEDSTHTYVLIFDLTDGSLEHKTTFRAVSSYSLAFGAGMISEGLYIITDFNGSSFNGTRMVDIVNGTEYPTNWWASDGWFMNAWDDKGLCEFYRYTDRPHLSFLGYNPMYLTTINNLQSPVTKTAAQTMKVTYTLTEE